MALPRPSRRACRVYRLREDVKDGTRQWVGNVLGKEHHAIADEVVWIEDGAPSDDGIG